jgi:hypothetical protein
MLSAKFLIQDVSHFTKKKRLRHMQKKILRVFMKTKEANKNSTSKINDEVWKMAEGHSGEIQHKSQ